MLIQLLEKISNIDEALLAVLDQRLREYDLKTRNSTPVLERLHQSAVGEKSLFRHAGQNRAAIAGIDGNRLRLNCGQLLACTIGAARHQGVDAGFDGGLMRGAMRNWKTTAGHGAAKYALCRARW